MRSLAVIFLILAAGAASAADRSPRTSRGVPYLAESIRLTNTGWKPVTLAGSPGCAGGDRRCESRPEVRACATDPMGPCGFTWTRNNRIVEVVTIGGNPPRVVRTRCLNGDGCR